MKFVAQFAVLRCALAAGFAFSAVAAANAQIPASVAVPVIETAVPIVVATIKPNRPQFPKFEGTVINATVAQKPYVMAYYGVKFLDDLHHNAVHEFKDWRNAPAPPLPAFVDTGTAIIDKANLATFREALAAHPKPL